MEIWNQKSIWSNHLVLLLRRNVVDTYVIFIRFNMDLKTHGLGDLEVLCIM